MLSLRALSVALSSVVVYNCVSLLANHAVSPVNATPEPQVSSLQCFLSTICCDEVTPFKQNVCPLASFIANEGMDLPDLSIQVGIGCSTPELLGMCEATATPVCCSTTIPTPTNILSVSGVNCSPANNLL
ncbi:hypothetical protein SCHPADRAFT_117352 [Schizopora paradoxa]|uniref:Hydrophobin n=1 Tax=Schizopora paradoxa TaxID=27342 RepID=A0A0H2S3N1_9AGAM|nr:hypothetical protein SCHPADRAFT_117352 [Schizopora paradoxa]